LDGRPGRSAPPVDAVGGPASRLRCSTSARDLGQGVADGGSATRARIGHPVREVGDPTAGPGEGRPLPRALRINGGSSRRPCGGDRAIGGATQRGGPSFAGSRYHQRCRGPGFDIGPATRRGPVEADTDAPQTSSNRSWGRRRRWGNPGRSGRYRTSTRARDNGRSGSATITDRLGVERGADHLSSYLANVSTDMAGGILTVSLDV